MSDTDAFTMPDDDAPPPPKVKAVAPLPPEEEGLLTDPGHVRGDLEQINKAVRLGWDVPQRLKDKILKRAEKIMDADTLPVFDANGCEVQSATKAHEIAVRTMAVVANMTGQDQADRHLEDKNKRLDEGKATENVVERTIKVEFDKRG